MKNRVGFCVRAEIDGGYVMFRIGFRCLKLAIVI